MPFSSLVTTGGIPIPEEEAFVVKRKTHGVGIRTHIRRVFRTPAFGGDFFMPIYFSLLAMPMNTANHVTAIKR